MSNELAQEILEMKERVQRELKEGGGMSPCPLCGLPRCQRSDYLRCARCGVNWLMGEDLTQNPKVSREPFLSSEYNRKRSASPADSQKELITKNAQD